MATAAWLPAALDDLKAIHNYIFCEQHSPQAASRLVTQITEKADLYCGEPLLGTSHPELGADVRTFTVHRYVVAYRPERDGIQVLRVIHGAQDILRVFHRKD